MLLSQQRNISLLKLKLIFFIIYIHYFPTAGTEVRDRIILGSTSTAETLDDLKLLLLFMEFHFELFIGSTATDNILPPEITLKVGPI